MLKRCGEVFLFFEGNSFVVAILMGAFFSVLTRQYVILTFVLCARTVFAASIFMISSLCDIFFLFVCGSIIVWP